MNKRFFMIVIGSAIIACLGGTFLLTKIHFSADSVPTRTAELAKLAQSGSGNDDSLPKVKINYPKADIEAALYNYQKTSLADLDQLSQKDKEILAAIEIKRRELAQQTLKSSDSDKTIDITFRIYDIKGEEVNQTSPQSGRPAAMHPTMNAVAASSIADNFDFGSDVPQQTKDLLVAAYSKIEAFYGPRSGTNKIKVQKISEGCAYGRSCYSSYDNSIRLLPIAITDNFTITHELIHAFHGAYVLRPLWEEGMTESATELILKINSSYINSLQSNYELTNQPSSSFKETLVAEGIDPYAWGSAAMYKIYLEDNNFYKKFNQKLYDFSRSSQTYPNDPVLIKLVSETVPQIEGESSLDWFAHQYPFVQPVYNGIDDSASGTIDPNVTKKLWSLWISALPEDIKTVDIKAYDSQNTLLAQCSGSPTLNGFDPGSPTLSGFDAADPTYSKNCKTYKFDTKFVGLVKIITTSNGNLSNQTINYEEFNLADTYQNNYPNIHGIVTNYPEANQAIITNLATNQTVTLPVKNGAFYSTDNITKNSGKYRISVLSNKRVCKRYAFFTACSNKTTTVANRYFNKTQSDPKSPYEYYGLLIESNIKSPIQSITGKPLNRSFSTLVQTNGYQGIVFRLDGVPISRAWTNKYDFTADNLNKNTNYNYSISVASNYKLTATSPQTIKTLAGEDFRLLKSTSFGDPSAGTFYQRLTFNSAYSENSAKLLSLSRDVKETDTTPDTTVSIRKVDAKTLDLIPQKKIYNNADYSINSIYSLTDVIGNPIYNLNYQISMFHTPLNPATTEAPVYSLAFSQINITDPVLIKTNFVSTQLANHIDPKYQNLLGYLSTLGKQAVDPKGVILASEVVRVKTEIEKCKSQMNESCKAYDLNGDGKTDDADYLLIDGYSKKGVNIGDLSTMYARISIMSTADPENWEQIFPIVTQIDANTYKLTFSSPLKSNTSYMVTMPVLVDDYNNIIENQNLTFSTK